MAMTASVMTADRQRIMDAGFDAYQSKPIKVKDFVAAVERLLDSGSSTILEIEEWSAALVSSPP
jgi:CheY-like chemotaxis protein